MCGHSVPFSFIFLMNVSAVDISPRYLGKMVAHKHFKIQKMAAVMTQFGVKCLG